MSLKNKLQPLVSVIVPIYNAEKYIDECVTSIINQTYRNLEIILVDDKSPDNSGKIADQWAKKDKRIKVIHKKQNEGINPGRETGFSNSKGEYVMFVDNDDIIHEKCIDDHMGFLMESGADVSISKAFWFNDGDYIDTDSSYKQGGERIKVLNRKLAYRSLITETSPFSDSEVGMLWNRIHKRSFFENYDWSLSDMPAEDFMTNAYLFDRIDSVVYIDSIHYFHRVCSTSTMQQLKKKGGANAKQKITIFKALFLVSNVFEQKSRENNWNFSREILYFKYRYFMIRVKAFLSGNSFTEEDFIELKKYTSSSEIEELLSTDFGRYLSEYIFFPASQIYSGQMVDFWRIFSESETLVEFIEKQLNNSEQLNLEKVVHIAHLNGIIAQQNDILNYLQSLKGSFFNFLGKIKYRLVIRTLRMPRYIINRLKENRLNRKYRDCWIVMDRVENACDNGYWYYRHLLENHPDINAFFAISKDSPDVEKLQNLGFQLILIDSEDHQYAIRNAKNLIYAYYTFDEYKNETARRIFIQHGIAKDDLPNPDIRRSDYWITSLDAEQAGYAERVDMTAVKIGLPRYESLIKKYNNYNGEKNKIVIAPTWRTWLYGDITKIKQDQYYQNWQKFLKSKELKYISKKYEVIFILHPMMKNAASDKKVSIFDIPEFITFTSYDKLGAEGLHDLLVETNLTITDFSSIPFDAALVGSNVVYFQFDKQDYYNKGNMRPGWFDYERDGFGPVYYYKNDLTRHIMRYNGKTDLKYQKRRSDLLNEITAAGHISEKITRLILKGRI